MLLTACRSTKVVEKKVVPHLDYPEFPLADEMHRLGNGWVEVPEQWIVDVEEYHIKITETENVYNRLRELYGEEE